jgi:hypothetical protein
VRDREHFKQAIRTKIIREIAELAPARPLIHLAQSPAQTLAQSRREKGYDCLIGETQWRERMGP